MEKEERKNPFITREKIMHCQLLTQSYFLNYKSRTIKFRIYFTESISIYMYIDLIFVIVFSGKTAIGIGREPIYRLSRHRHLKNAWITSDTNKGLHTLNTAFSTYYDFVKTRKYVFDAAYMGFTLNTFIGYQSAKHFLYYSYTL